MIQDLRQKPKDEGKKITLKEDLIKVLEDGRHQVLARAGKQISKGQFEHLQKTYDLTPKNTLGFTPPKEVEPAEEKAEKAKENKSKAPGENKKEGGEK